MKIERWALPLLKSVGLVPKSSKIIARSRIKCASCEICSYHLGLESPDLSPPLNNMHICDVCNRTYHWHCLLKTSCCNATERDAIDANDSWACPACINLNQNEKESRIHFQRREMWKSHGTQPGSQKNYKTRLKASSRASKSLKSISLHQTYLSLHQMNTYMIFKNKGYLPSKRAIRTNPTMSIFGTKLALTSNPPTHRLTLWPQGIVSTGFV